MKKVTAVVRYNFIGFGKDARVRIVFLLGIILSYLLTQRVIRVAEGFETSMQAAEPFIWTFGDATAILMASLLLILLFNDVPKVRPVTPLYLMRMSRREWMAAQFVYLAAGTAVYVVFILLVTCILCIDYTFPGNLWSETAARIGYSDLTSSLGIPASVKAMESILPYQCMFQTALLILLYSWTLGFLMLAVNLRFGKSKGIFAGILYSVYGFLLNPEVIAAILNLDKHQRYRINRLVGWLSPLNHAAFPGHSFGYDGLPTIFQSVCVFLVLLALLYAAASRALHSYNFTFLGF